MGKRFFKLLYIILLIGIAAAFPIYALSHIQFDAVVRTTYKVKCIANNQYVVLEGSQLNDIYTFEEFMLDSPFDPNFKRDLNFRCQYYDDIQPFIMAYVNSKTKDEQINVNANYFRFQESVISNVNSYPPLYTLETVSEITNMGEVWNPIIEALMFVLISFISLQFIKICYQYIVNGKIHWHPLK